MDRLSHRELTMNPGRLRRNAARLVAALALGLGLVAVQAGVARADDSVWNVASVTLSSEAGASSGSSVVFTPQDSVWN
jgi:hypothetical protein